MFFLSSQPPGLVRGGLGWGGDWGGGVRGADGSFINCRVWVRRRGGDDEAMLKYSPSDRVCVESSHLTALEVFTPVVGEVFFQWSRETCRRVRDDPAVPSSFRSSINPDTRGPAELDQLKWWGGQFVMCWGFEVSQSQFCQFALTNVQKL